MRYLIISLLLSSCSLLQKRFLIGVRAALSEDEGARMYHYKNMSWQSQNTGGLCNYALRHSMRNTEIIRDYILGLDMYKGEIDERYD